MTQHFNKKEMQERRRQLRNNMTYCERIVWMYLPKKQMHVRFLRQYSVDNYVIDFYCPKLKIAVEIDGDVHDLLDQKEHDILRQKYLEEYGIKFIRVKNEELFDKPNKALEELKLK